VVKPGNYDQQQLALRINTMSIMSTVDTQDDGDLYAFTVSGFHKKDTLVDICHLRICRLV
jgi:hypothetical protein